MIDPKTVKPVGTKVLLRRHPRNESIGMIITPENRIEKNMKCTVVAKGPGKYVEGKGYLPQQFKVGDVVLVRQWLGILLNHGGQIEASNGEKVNSEDILFIDDYLIEGIYTQEQALPI